jgi:carnitine O-acetyltransferase
MVLIVLLQAREYLLTLSPTNRETLTEIEDSLFVLSLDDWTLMHSSAHPTSISSRLAPTSSATFEFDPSLELDSQILAASSGRDGHNRWFDKSFTINVESNSRAGVLGDHSPCDGLIPGIIADYMSAQGIGKLAGNNNVQQSEEGWVRLRWVTDAVVERYVEEAKATVKKVIADSDALALWFDEYGVDWIKHSG